MSSIRLYDAFAGHVAAALEGTCAWDVDEPVAVIDLNIACSGGEVITLMNEGPSRFNGDVFEVRVDGETFELREGWKRDERGDWYLVPVRACTIESVNVYLVNGWDGFDINGWIESELVA